MLGACGQGGMVRGEAPGPFPTETRGVAPGREKGRDLRACRPRAPAVPVGTWRRRRVIRDTADPDDDEEVQLYRGLLGSGESGSDSESVMSMVGGL